MSEYIEPKFLPGDSAFLRPTVYPQLAGECTIKAAFYDACVKGDTLETYEGWWYWTTINHPCDEGQTFWSEDQLERRLQRPMPFVELLAGLQSVEVAA